MELSPINKATEELIVFLAIKSNFYKYKFAGHKTSKNMKVPTGTTYWSISLVDDKVRFALHKENPKLHPHGIDKSAHGEIYFGEGIFEYWKIGSDGNLALDYIVKKLKKTGKVLHVNERSLRIY